MAIQFIDMRLSLQNNEGDLTFVGIAPTPTPLMIGDIGLQTVSVVGTANQSNVRVWLSGTVGLRFATTSGEPPPSSVVTFIVSRNSDGGDPASGTIILTEVINTTTYPFNVPVSITSSDFPPSNEVEAGEIRYSLYVQIDAVVEGTTALLTGPTAFNGMAAAGTT
ncbi:hypothetical protein ACFO9Q_04270 [Paenibacillus sp. GCM10023252]|uniref:hypothetical protein n=1 Tax=Paenibacillus sp. GCM10023252 TaxID=3252649 RepID=UPI003615B54C